MKKKLARWLSILLILSMSLGLMMPAVLAADETGLAIVEPVAEETVENVEAEITAELMTTDTEEGTDGSEGETTDESQSETTDEPSITDYESFLANLKVLEGYAEAFAASNSSYSDVNLLMINYIRTGVERYLDGNWKTLAGEEITAFTTYVSEQDAANGTTAAALRNLELFALPNGNEADFGHMFGMMNIAWVASVQSADLGGWAGDICDLMLYSYDHGNVPEGTVDEMAAYILENCFGVNADDAFGWDDFYGDMDGFYLVTKLKEGENFVELVEGYFTESLDDVARTAFFMNNRFKGMGLETQEDVRTAVYDIYSSNVGLQVLEADRGLTDYDDFRTAACYAFADYLFAQGGHLLDTGDDSSGEEGGEEGGETGGEEGGETGGDEGGEEETPSNPYYTVFSEESSILAPGISQEIKYAMTADEKQIVYYVATVDVTRDDVTIMANYKDNDPSKGWGMSRVIDQANAMVAKHTDPTDTENYIENFNAIVATNADGYNMSTGEPGGLLVMEGVEWHAVDGDGFFAILKDGSAMIGTKADYETYKAEIQEGVGGFGATLIKNGEISINKSTNYYTSRASRTAIGITAEGKVVMMVLDGRQEPFSAGGSMEEIAQIMYEAGCVEAINLDGGGSSTYAAKLEGSDTLSLVNRPSDGYARSVSTSLVAVSTAKSSKEFDHAILSSEYDYLTVGTELQIEAIGVTNTGNSASIPENAVWQVSDETIGTVTQDGLFTAAANGDVEVQIVVDGTVVGSKELHVVIPDTLSFTKEHIALIYGEPTKLPLEATYNGNIVLFNANDIYAGGEYEEAAIFEGDVVTAIEESGIRTMLIAALVLTNEEAYAEASVTMYNADEASFDFDNATAGDRQLAWNREVTNAITSDEVFYMVEDPAQDMEVSYTFALDMTQIEIPEQLADLTYMLPGADTGATAWDFLLQLAERVSEHTEVRITANFDADVTVDVSEMKVINEYFSLHSAVMDESTNTLTIVCTWNDQTQAIAAATANPICILTGIKVTPKDGAWDADDQMDVVNSGEVSYEIYLRASSLYSFASKPANQEKYGLKPYSSETYTYNGGPEQGASFGSTYATFEDSFTLDKSIRQGWYSVDSQLFYYVDHVALTGIHKVPGYEDPTQNLVYEFDENGACQGVYTGLFEQDGKVMYALMGIQKYGWQSIMDSDGESYYYYFNPYTGGAVNGACHVEGYDYVFVDYKCMEGQIVSTADGYKYRFANFFLRNQWLEVDGNWYYIERDYYFLTDGIYWVRTIDGESSARHIFDEKGVLQRDINGLYHVGEDTYLVAGGIILEEPGLVYIDGYYYYFAATGKAVKNRTYWPSKTNGLLPMAAYIFDDQGRITNPPAVEPPVEEPEEPDTPVEPEEEVKDGLIYENGGYFYYKDGKIQYAAGLIQIGEDYYYIRSTGQAAVGNYWVTRHNDLLPQGMYTFGADGKMVTGEEEPEEPDSGETETPTVKDGFISENGAIYYYKEGKIQYCAGLIYVDGYYYYVRSNGQLAHGKYWTTNHNGLLPATEYFFDELGRMTNPPTTEPSEPDTEEKNGIVSENGGLYYYVDGVMQIDLGLIEIDGDYYYVRSTGLLATGEYWVSKTNGLVEEGMYTFGTDGKMVNDSEDSGDTTEPEVLNGIVDVNGTLYYYENGTIAYAKGLVQLEDGAYIYVRSNGQLATGVYWPTNHNGLLPYKGYDFGTDGRLYL